MGAGQEIGEGVHLVRKLSAFIPRSTKFATTADMGKGEDDSTVEQWEAKGRKGRVFTRLIGPISVEHRWCWSVFESCEIVAPHQTEGDPGSVRSGGRNSSRAVAVFGKAPEDLLLFQDVAVASGKVELEHCTGLDHGGLAETQ